ncbi:MAG: heavy metal translocating P-type ATPase metal-binding domain-containing protein [Chitinophagaceae bacterium]|nr:heavy metal translocating P-type ATPase metal-binding domain-containing protein [Chitinophagaceae bacterium]
MASSLTSTKTTCYHCGEPCTGTVLQCEEKSFCCQGCLTVYEILAANQLCRYYTLDEKPGLTQQGTHINTYYDFLDDSSVQDKLIHFREGTQCHVKFIVPVMHCSSCIWLLENLCKINPGIQSSRVNFLEKEVSVIFDSAETSLKEVVILLKKIGYEPNLSFEDLQHRSDKKINRVQIYKIAIAGFCFGNIMMLSLPDYFAGGRFLNDQTLNLVFNYLSLALSLPVFFYCARESWVSSWQYLKQRKLNIDQPIALAIIIAFGVSIWQIVINNRMGYLDSMSGIVFFMLLGRFFQNRSYNYLSFRRSVSSYLPIAVNQWLDGKEHNRPLTDIQIGDEILIRQQEIVPTDAVLMGDEAWFDYSFVTGESNWVKKHPNELIYAGAILKSGMVHLTVAKHPSQSYITQLWNSQRNTKYKSNTLLTTEKINLYFSATVFLLGLFACGYWMMQGQVQTGFIALITVWIVACPCALLLSSTFTYGNMLTILTHNGLYIKNAAVLEKMRWVDALVFDKTGTLTRSGESEVDFVGRDMQPAEWQQIAALTRRSIHPLSKAITQWLSIPEHLPVEDYQSVDGQGISGVVQGQALRIGSAHWVGAEAFTGSRLTRVYIKIGNEIAGFFEIRNQYRKDIKSILKRLGSKFSLHLLSGDQDAEKKTLSEVFTRPEQMRFNQLPEDKTKYIQELQAQGKTVMMIGDGLNDATAFEQSDAGVAIIEQENNFLPACDVILLAPHIHQFNELMAYVGKAKTILISCFVLSLLYNIIGLSFAMQGLLTPVIAAILMPVSTVSIVGTSYLLSRYYARHYKLET